MNCDYFSHILIMMMMIIIIIIIILKGHYLRNEVWYTLKLSKFSFYIGRDKHFNSSGEWWFYRVSLISLKIYWGIIMNIKCFRGKLMNELYQNFKTSRDLFEQHTCVSVLIVFRSILFDFLFIPIHISRIFFFIILHSFPCLAF